MENTHLVRRCPEVVARDLVLGVCQHLICTACSATIPLFTGRGDCHALDDSTVTWQKGTFISMSSRLPQFKTTIGKNV